MLEVFDDEHGDQCCPNLDVECVLAGAHEGFHFEVLLESLEEDLDLPSVLVYGGNGACRKREVIRQELNLPLMFLVPHDDPAQDMGALLPGPWSGKTDELVSEDILVQRDIPFLNHFVDGIVLHPGNEEDPRLGPEGEQAIIVVAPVHGDYGTGRERGLPGNGHVMLLAVGDIGITGKIPIVIQEKMQLHCALRSPVLGPGEKRQAQGYGRGVQGKQLVLEPEFPLLALHTALVSLEQLIEEIPVHLPGPLRIRIAERGLLRGIPKAQMLDLAHTAGKPSADLPDALGLCQLTKQHGDKVGPGTEPFRMFLGIMIHH